VTSDIDVLEERIRQTFHEVAASSVVVGATHGEAVRYSKPDGGAFPWQWRVTSIAFVSAVVVAAIVLVFAAGPFSAKNHSVPVSGTNTPEARFEAAFSRTRNLKSYKLTAASSPLYFTLYDNGKTETISSGTVEELTSGTQAFIPVSTLPIGPRCVIHAKFLSTGGFSGMEIEFTSLPGHDPSHSVVHEVGDTYVVTSPGEGTATYTVRNGFIVKIVTPPSKIQRLTNPSVTFELSKLNQPMNVVLPKPSEVEPLLNALTAPGCSTNRASIQRTSRGEVSIGAEATS
jgi:hypothetical protein